MKYKAYGGPFDGMNLWLGTQKTLPFRCGVQAGCYKVSGQWAMWESV